MIGCLRRAKPPGASNGKPKLSDREFGNDGTAAEAERNEPIDRASASQRSERRDYDRFRLGFATESTPNPRSTEPPSRLNRRRPAAYSSAPMTLSNASRPALAGRAARGRPLAIFEAYRSPLAVARSRAKPPAINSAKAELGRRQPSSLLSTPSTRWRRDHATAMIGLVSNSRTTRLSCREEGCRSSQPSPSQARTAGAPEFFDPPRPRRPRSPMPPA